ncbi:uncharacterized protein [Halyomorpha halys]|uniref:uncharacterized protein n=1 Tax=Halyomorpha halys TaxID=286706 RepID=UPI000D0C7971|nr:igLON family member 5-like [Halyomorpha halys]
MGPHEAGGEVATRDIFAENNSSLVPLFKTSCSPTPPQFVMWYHNDKMINYEEGESQLVQVVTEPGGEKTHSKLLIPRANPKHSGNYSCMASNSEPDSVHVFVSTANYHHPEEIKPRAVAGNR